MTYFTNTKAQVSVDVPRGVIYQMFEWLETIGTKEAYKFFFLSPFILMENNRFQALVSNSFAKDLSSLL